MDGEREGKMRERKHTREGGRVGQLRGGQHEWLGVIGGTSDNEK